MSPEERRRRGTELCRRLAAEVHATVPRGIGRWAPAWDIVGGADANFVAALTAWEADPTERARAHVRTAYRAVVSAWREASDRYESERAGR